MRGATLLSDVPESHPLDVVEQIVASNEWIYDRQGEHELLVQVAGHWCDFNLFFAWNDSLSALHFSCAFDLRVPAERLSAVHELLAVANERMWLGYFSLWHEEGLPMFRHVLLLRDTDGPSHSQLDDVIDTALTECDRFYPAFQYVIWGGKSPKEAIEAAMIDTVGEA